MPEGLARVLDMMNQSIAPRTVAANDPATGKPKATHGLMSGPSGDDDGAPVLDHEGETVQADRTVLTPGDYTLAAA